MHETPIEPSSPLEAGIACLKAGDRLAEAVTLLEEAYRVEPNGRSQRLWLAIAYRGQRRLDMAARLLDQILLETPDDSAALAHRGVVAFQQGEGEGAARRLCTAWIADPLNDYARDWLGRIGPDWPDMEGALTILCHMARAFPERRDLTELTAGRLGAGLQACLAQGRTLAAEALARALEAIGSPLASWHLASRARRPIVSALAGLLGDAGPVRMLDIGASGYTSSGGWELLEGQLEVHGVDPDAQACEQQNAQAARDNLAQRFYPVALAGTAGPRTLYVTRSRYCTSLFQPNMPLLRRFRQFDAAGHPASVADAFDVVATPVIDTTTLDACVARFGIGPLDHVKLDVQGAELEILQGGTQALRHATSVLVEVEFVPLYHGQPLFAEIDLFLRAQGFTFFNFMQTHSGHYAGRMVSPLQVETRDGDTPIRQIAGQLVTTDALYLRDPLSGGDSTLPAGMDWNRWLRAALVAAVMDQPEFAMELLDWLCRAAPERAPALRALLETQGRSFTR